MQVKNKTNNETAMLSIHRWSHVTEERSQMLKKCDGRTDLVVGSSLLQGVGSRDAYASKK